MQNFELISLQFTFREYERADFAWLLWSAWMAASCVGVGHSISKASADLKCQFKDTFYWRTVIVRWVLLPLHTFGWKFHVRPGQGSNNVLLRWTGLDWSQGLQFLYRSTCWVQYLDSWRVNLSHLTWPVQIWSSSVIKVPPTKLTIVDELCKCSLCIIW